MATPGSPSFQQVSLEEDFLASQQYGAAGVPAQTGAEAAPMYPYPGISPYDHKFSRTFNEGGLWKHETEDGPRRYFFTLEGFAAQLRKPGRQPIGAKLGDPEDIPILVAGGNIGLPLLTLQNTGDLLFKHDLNTEGIRARWGFDNQDGSGFVVEGFWASDVSNSHNYNPLGDISDPTTYQDFLAVPAFNDSEFGTLIRYDLKFQVDYAAEAFGASMNLLQMPKFGRRSFKIRPLYGIRYLHINESFGFQGADSALTYDSTTSFINGFPVSYMVDVDSVEDNPFGNPQFQTFIDSNVWSHLVGPEIGFQFEIGGTKFRLVGHTKFALLGNAEKIKLSGDDFGNGYLIDLGADTAGENFFSQTEYHAHVSPAFEQTLSAEAQLFGLIPVLKRIPALDSAVFRIGISYLAVAEVARPADTITYNALPLFPEIEVDRSRWDMYTMNFGITWRR